MAFNRKTHTNTAAANTEVVITIAEDDEAIPGGSGISPNPGSKRVSRKVSSVSWSYNTAANGTLTIESPASTVIHQYDIVAGGPGQLEFTGGLPGADGQALVIRLTAGTGAIGKLNAVEEL